MLHVEPVFRTDLVGRFRQRQKEIYDELYELDPQTLRQCVSGKAPGSHCWRDSKDDLFRELCRPG